MASLNDPSLLAALIWLMLIVVVGGYVYFVPSLVAHHRGHHQMMPIFLLNLFLGWSLIGWVAALVWATVALPEFIERGR